MKTLLKSMILGMMPFVFILCVMTILFVPMTSILPVWGGATNVAAPADIVSSPESEIGFVEKTFPGPWFRVRYILALGLVAMTVVALVILYRFLRYDRQVCVLMQNQQNFDLLWGDLKKRRLVSKGNYPFFRHWGLAFSGQSCSIDELSSIFGWDFYDDYSAEMNAMKEQGSKFIVTEKTVVSPVDGKKKHYRRFMNRVDDRRFMSCVQDITEQYEAEIQERFLVELLAAMSDGLVFYDRDMNILRHNGQVGKIIPFPHPTEKICYKAIHGRDEPCPRCPVMQTWEDGERHRETYLFEERKQWLELFSYPIRDLKTGEVVRVLEVVRDITRQHNWENALLEREKYLTDILEASHDGIIAISDIDDASHVNSRFIEMFGCDPAEFQQKVSTEQFLEIHRKLTSDWEEIQAARQRMIETNEPQSGVLHFYDGRIIDWQVEPGNFGENGEANCHAGWTRIWTYRDVTERFKTAAAIQRSELKFRAIFNSSASGHALFDVVPGADGRPVDFRCTDVNPAWEKIYGTKKESLLGRSLVDFFSNAKIDSNADHSESLVGESVLTPCLQAMKGESGTYIIHFEKNNRYHSITVFKTETEQLAIFVTDDTARIKDERALRTMRTVIDQLSEPVIWLTREGSIRYINEAGGKCLGFEQSELIFGAKIWRFDISMLTEERWQELLEKLDVEESQQFETRLKRKDGVLIPAAVVVNQIEHDGRRLVAICFRDLSELHRRLEAEKTAMAKSRFLDHMSHEIRTPLNGMLGATNLLLETELTPRQKSYVDLASSTGKQLLKIVNSILDYSDIHTQKIVLYPARFDLSGLLYSVIAQASEDLQENDAEKKIELAVEFATPIPRYLVGDMERLEKIIVALIDNAVKFTKRGMIMLTVSDEGHASRQEGMPCMLRVDVVDTGCGISREERERLFESFTLGDSSLSRERGGTGLGLITVKNLVELMGGVVDFESKAEQGLEYGSSRFWFTIPLPIEGSAFIDTKKWIVRETPLNAAKRLAPAAAESPIPEDAAEKTEPDRPVEPRESPLILVVEDNVINQIVIREILKNGGFVYEVAENGQIACDKVAEKKFSLILMDCQMPVMDGLEATRKIRDMEAGNAEKIPGHAGHIPIIALTANALKGDEDACLQAGMDSFCSKPVQAPHLLEMIRDQLRKT